MKATLRIAAIAVAATALALSGPSAAWADPATTQAPAARRYPQVTHVAWVVPNLDRALAAAATQLGTGPANVVFRRVIEVDGGTYNGRPARFSADFAIIEVGNTQLEYIQPLTGVSPYSDALKRGRGAVLHHMAFTVPDLDKHIAAARAADPAARVVLDARIKGLGARFVYMSGVLPDTLVEFIAGR